MVFYAILVLIPITKTLESLKLLQMKTYGLLKKEVCDTSTYMSRILNCFMKST